MQVTNLTPGIINGDDKPLMRATNLTSGLINVVEKPHPRYP